MTREQMETHLTLLGWWANTSSAVYHGISSADQAIYCEKHNPVDYVSDCALDAPDTVDPWDSLPDWAFWKMVEWMRQNGRLG